MNRFRRIATTTCVVVAAAGCYDLSVGTSFDELTREAVLEDAALVETVIASSGVEYWCAVQNCSYFGGNNTAPSAPWVAMEVMGERLTSSSDLAQMYTSGREPRVPLPNQPGTIAINTHVWQRLYEANSSVTEMQRNIRNKELRLIDAGTGNDNTTRAIAFSKFIQGVTHGYLSLIFDRAAIVNIDTDLSVVPILPLEEYTVVRDSALKWLNEAAALAESNTFFFPNTNALWFPNQGVSNALFADIVHTYIARVMVYSARTPAERAAVDWATVLQHLEKSVKSDFGLGGDGTRPSNVWDYGYKMITFNPPVSSNNRSVTNSARVDLRLLGPADTMVMPDGRTQYQTWLETVRSQDGRDGTVGFPIFSPDKRIQSPLESGNDASKPIFFQFTPALISGNLPGAGTPIQPPERGLYYSQSPYHSSSMLASPNESGGGRNTTGNLDGLRDIGLRPVEVEMLKAEAYIRLNNPAAALPFINRTRVANGNLPPVDLNGPPKSTPEEIAGCVPRRYDGTCGDLWDALIYEKRIETFGTHGLIPWADGRGWGCLLEGTLTELPIPARQLDLMNEAAIEAGLPPVPLYTFGGRPGERGSAPVPANCPLLFRPTGNG